MIGGVLATAVVYGLVSAGGRHVDTDSPAVGIPASIIFELILVGCALLFAAQVTRPRPWQFGLRPTRVGRALGWAALAAAIYFVCSIVYGAAVHPDEQSTLKDLGAGTSGLATVGIGVLVVAVAPVCEEFFFRGFLYGALRSRLSFVPAAIIDGVAFGVVHAGTGPQAIPPLVVLGFVFCMVYEATGSIFPTIALHSLNNMVAFGFDKDGSWLVAAVAAAVVVSGCFALPRRVVA
ncbi:MAG: CPBP family intramembrane glutamic endopeptidase [Thermoleophilaceae bacterium]